MFSLFVDPIYNPALKNSMGKGEGTVIIGNLISRLIQIALIIGVLVTFLYFFLAGFQWITSGGDEKKVAAARAQITNALIGLAIVFAAWAILALIKALFGVDIGGTDFGLPQFY